MLTLRWTLLGLIFLSCGRTGLLDEPEMPPRARVEDPALTAPCATSCCRRHFTVEKLGEGRSRPALLLDADERAQLAWSDRGNTTWRARRESTGWISEIAVAGAELNRRRLLAQQPLLSSPDGGEVQLLLTTTAPPSSLPFLPSGPVASSPDAGLALRATQLSGKGSLVAAAQYIDGPLTLVGHEVLPFMQVLWADVTREANGSPALVFWQQLSDPLDADHVEGRIAVTTRRAGRWTDSTLELAPLSYLAALAEPGGGIRVLTSIAGTGGPIREHVFDGRTWSARELIGGLNHLQQVQVDSRGQQHLVFFHFELGSAALHYACWDGTGWLDQVVDADLAHGWGGAALVLDSLDRPRMAWSSVEHGLQYAR